MNVCTIVSAHEVARARVAIDSLREHHPDAQPTVLLLDGGESESARVEGAELLSLEQLLGEHAGLLAAANPPGALAVATLPHLLRRMLDAGAERILYLAAGQRVLQRLDELLELLAETEIALVARSAISADDGEAFAEDRVGGAVSRDLLGVRAGSETDLLLRGWPRCFVGEGDDGRAAVRSWLDGIPALAAGAGVLRDPGYGLDPWSLASRALGDAREGRGAELVVDGTTARTFDFSGLDPDDPAAWFDGSGRVPLSSSPALERLAARQAEELKAAGWERQASQAPAYAQLPDGLRLTDTVRALFVQAIAARRVTSSPFTQAGRRELYEYLNEPDERGAGAGLTRLHLAIWDARADLRAEYPHLDGPDGPGFAGWLGRFGAEQEGLVADLQPPMPELAYRDADPHVHEQEPRWGANVVGFFTAELGVGEAARQLISGLDAAGVPALPVQGQLAPPSRRLAEFDHVGVDDAAFPINILCVNGDGIPVFAREAGRQFFADRYTIALWWWEVGEPPASWRSAYEFIDEVWVGSEHIYDAIAPSSPVPVVRVRLPVATPQVADVAREQLGMPDGFVFLFVYDYHSVAARKNPLGLIEAFARAFPPGSGAKLVLKSINAESALAQHERVRLAAARHPDVVLFDGYLAAAEKNAMIAACDCYVSLHRSEGFGLTAAEAMLLGKPVIATRYGGTMEFMNERNSYLVSWQPAPVGEGSFPYDPGDTWADPDLDDAARLMREVFERPEEARRRGAVARRELLESHSPAAAGATMRRRLTLVHGRLRERGARTLNLTHLQPLHDEHAMLSKIAGGPTIDWGSGRLARIRWRAQRPIADWSRAYVEHQSGVDTELLRAVDRIDAGLRDVARTLHEQQRAQHAETLAVLRRLEAELAEIRGALDRPQANGPREDRSPRG